MDDLHRDYWSQAPNNMLREIANDNLTPKNKNKKNTDGLFETTDCSDPNHECICGAKNVLTED
tara:strand:+ start:1857 stop:2045 length:189 start_codon:yes stop_codon:yes gene_type:complete